MLEPAFALLGATVTWLELWAFLLALACVICTVFEIHWGWPLAFISSLLYAWLFVSSKLYGEGGLQLFFAATAVWGWWQWLFGRRAGAGGESEPLAVARLRSLSRLALVGLWMIAWPATGLLLAHITDTDVPYLDAFPTVGSVIGQVMLARKFIENWPVWLVVNVASVGVFAYKGLTLTVVLYVIFALLALAGWLRWARVQAG
ncbi:MAG TPA: nicotinamide riboside transporter PnuC [Burkholderiaceae bacterium]|nr:nicotinamide riboside transporter PnuC [Burkholderiaceae bacterium]